MLIWHSGQATTVGCASYAVVAREARREEG